MAQGHIADSQHFHCPLLCLPCCKTFGSVRVTWGGTFCCMSLCHMRAGTGCLSVLIEDSRKAINYPASLFYQQTCPFWHWCVRSHFPRQPQAFVGCMVCSASCFLPFVLPFSSSVPSCPVCDSFLHSCIHLCVHPCLPPAATV